MPFIHDDFVLRSNAAQVLYHRYAKCQPILDYHCHLPPEDIAADRRFSNLFEIWLEGDHYKWRAMRANGVKEPYVTGDASPRDKFIAWAETVPYTLRNPLYHWTHLELKRYFQIDELLGPDTAANIWDKTCELLEDPSMSARGIMNTFKVRAVCTTDDPADELVHHQAIAESDCKTKVYPTFRPDKALTVDNPAVFNEWCDRLAATANVDVSSLSGLLDAIKTRHDAFHAIGGRLSDHGLSQCFAETCSDTEAAAIFDQARSGNAADPTQHAKFASYMMFYFGRLDAEKGWTKQIHLGPRRNNNTRLFKQLGPDTGFDSIGAFPQADALGAYLDRLDQENSLPRMVLYNLNPSDNYLFATMAGNFQDGSIAGKIQFGSGWWFLDQKEAMEWQMNALSNNGLLSRFIGMLTDSRSFMSFPRHEYFRRTLCNLVGQDVEDGLLPDDETMIGEMIRSICYANARDFLRLDVPED